MNQSLRLRFDQLRESDPTRQQTPPGAADDYYADPATTRNVCFVWPDGRRVFFNYAYLMAGEYEPGQEKNVIRLTFSAHQVTLLGYGLETLYAALLDHLPRLIVAIDPRYVATAGSDRALVVDIQVTVKAEQ